MKLLISDNLRNPEIRREIIDLLDRVQTDSKVQIYLDYAKRAAYNSSEDLLKAFQGEVFSPDFIILESTKIDLANEINQALENHEKAKQCHICEKPIVSGETKIKDHCLLTGK